MAYADHCHVPSKRRHYLSDADLMRKQRRLADKLEELRNRILCKQIDPDEHLLSSPDACREENIAAVKNDERRPDGLRVQEGYAADQGQSLRHAADALN